MGLAWELHELIQDFVDGKLSPEREAEVQAFLDRHPAAQQVADQYRMVTQPDLVQPVATKLEADILADRVMAAIPSGPWWSFVQSAWFITGMSVTLAVALFTFVVDFAVLTSWFQARVLDTMAGFNLIADAINAATAKAGKVAPILIASGLIVGFWAIVDRLIKLSTRTNRA